MHDYHKIAAIVGEDKIEALREAGVEIGDKPTKPTTGLLGRWVKDPRGNDVMITQEMPYDSGEVLVTYLSSENPTGVKTALFDFDVLVFPEETTRPEDVPVGEAWLVNVDDGKNRAESVVAIKYGIDDWLTNTINKCEWWMNSEVTLVSPLVPARPDDTRREPETVTTEEEYKALPVGSIVAEPHGTPFVRRGIGAAGRWVEDGVVYTDLDMAGTESQVLRRGWE